MTTTKHTYSRERKRKREEFIRKYKDKIVELAETGDYNHFKIRHFIQGTIRVELGYNPSTVNQDIWNSILKTFKQIFPDHVFRPNV